MKKLLLFIGLALVSYAVQAQNWGREFSLSYDYAKPLGGMGHIIQQGHGAAMTLGFVKPDERFAFGIDLGIAQYGRDKSRQEYTLDDGTVAPMDIIVSNTFVNITAYSRWYLATQGLMRPYLVGKLGYSAFSTNLNIFDPDDFDHCEPVDSDVLHNDGTIIAVVGGGVKVDIATAFRKVEPGRFYLDANINFTQGGQVRYMNADFTPHHHNNMPESEDVTARFLNTDTQVVHEHHVGYLYRSPVQMLELRVGFLMNISR